MTKQSASNIVIEHTVWFKFNSVHPTVEGVYKVITDRALRGFSYYKDGKWGRPANTAQNAETQRSSVSSDLILMWQGILHEGCDSTLTGWLHVKTPPVREGVYRAFYNDSQYGHFAYFKNNEWYERSPSPNGAHNSFIKGNVSITKPLYWRGLNKKHP